MSTWAEFDKSIDLQALKTEDKNTEYREVPIGNYEVRIEKLELGKSKRGDAMVTTWFKILEGDYKNSLIFYYQVLTQNFQIKKLNEFLSDLSGEPFTFVSFEDLSYKIADMEIKLMNFEWAIEYQKSKNGFPMIYIQEIFEN